MKWKAFAQWEVRRRAVVSGRAFDQAGKPYTDAVSMSLCSVPDDGAPGASKQKGNVARPVRDMQTQPIRRYACHMRPDGRFFFLDVPAGSYVLNRVDAGGAIVQTQEVSLPPFEPDAKMPIVSIEFEIVKRNSESNLSSGQQMVRTRIS